MYYLYDDDDKPEGWGEKKREEFTANDYHKPTDQIKDDWDLAGAAADARPFAPPER